MSFFIRNKRKRKPDSKKKVGAVGKRADIPSLPITHDSEDEEIPSDSDIDSDEATTRRDAAYSSEEDEDTETAQEKRLRLAKEYLAQLETDKGEGEDGYDGISQILHDNVLEQRGKLQKEVARACAPPADDGVLTCRGHQLSPTCLVISPDDKHIYTGAKDCSLIKWSMSTGKKLKVIAGGRKGTEDKHKGHTTHVLCLAISSDGKFLVSGDRGKLIHVWNPDSMELIRTLRGHRDAVSGLVFRRGTHQLYSASFDRTVKTWDVDEMAFVETLYGHQDKITGVDSLSQERAVTCGARDGSVRVWKIMEESQLVFNGHSGSIDCVAYINEQHFVTGGDDNCLALWGMSKKKPLVTVRRAHPGGKNMNHWITAVQAMKYTDLIASGSHDGSVRLWRCGTDFRSLTLLFSLPLTGYVNSLQFSSEGHRLIAAVGQEHRLGRWEKIKTARNTVCIMTLGQKTAEEMKAQQEEEKTQSNVIKSSLKKKPLEKFKRSASGKKQHKIHVVGI